MLLVADIGNTSITFGLFDNKKLAKTFRIPTSQDLQPLSYKKELSMVLADCNVENCVIASVVNNVDIVLKTSVDELFGINSTIVTKDIIKNLVIDVENPETVGIDRVLNVVEAKSRYSQSILVIDVGTAITFDFIDHKGVFTGGAIMPGLNLQLKALNQFTSKLPLVDLQDSKNVMAKNTQDAILTGVVRGIGCAVSGLIEQYQKESKDRLVIIATGGQAEFISKYIGVSLDAIIPNLTLFGLRRVFEESCKL